MTFPTCLFHKTIAPDGQVFMTEADLPAADAGWVDTPAAFDPNYKAPTPVVPNGSIPADAPPGFVPNPYPSCRYRKGDPDNPRLVASAEEDAALEAAEPGVWQHSPDPKFKPPVAGPDAGAPDPNALADFVTAADGSVTLTDAQKAELYTAKVAEVVMKLEGISSPAMLKAIAAAEAENPTPRKTVAKAVAARLAVLNVGE